MKKSIILSTLLICILSLHAQSTFWEGGLFLGGSGMGGDLVDPDLGSLDDVSFAYGLMARRYFHSNFALRFSLLHSRLSGNDQRYELHNSRGIRTETPLTELSMDLEYDLLGHKRNRGGTGGISPYLFIGSGFAFTNPKPFFNFTNSEVIADQNADFSKTRFVLPVGGGIRFNLNQQWALALELAVRPTFSDYLDGVSRAGNPNKDDWYGFGSVQIWYKLSNTDKDGDGIADLEDACPEIAGLETTMGCPDKDNDGVQDSQDLCPDIPGVSALGGCPDSDNDGIPDAEDACPTQAGFKAKQGCPTLDTDEDGVEDMNDKCPNQAGPLANGGCPYQDTDGDGVLDRQDQCPNTRGPLANNGCPYQDTDGDGILDKDDKCPGKVGSVANGGCPESTVTQTVQDVLDFATRNVRFATDKDEFLSTSYSVMDEIAQVMRDYPAYHLKIDGYTDSTGASAYNQQLSESRARRCYDYLISKGILASRMQFAGYGEASPIADNLTESGRLQNRRVEFSVIQR